VILILVKKELTCDERHWCVIYRGY